MIVGMDGIKKITKRGYEIDPSTREASIDWFQVLSWRQPSEKIQAKSCWGR